MIADILLPCSAKLYTFGHLAIQLPHLRAHFNFAGVKSCLPLYNYKIRMGEANDLAYPQKLLCSLFSLDFVL